MGRQTVSWSIVRIVFVGGGRGGGGINPPPWVPHPCYCTSSPVASPPPIQNCTPSSSHTWSKYPSSTSSTPPWCTPLELKGLFKAGNLTISDHDMAGLVLNCLELECVTSNLANIKTSLFCDNTSAVGWSIKIISGSSLVVGRLLRFLCMCIHATQASYFTPIRILGEDNDISDVLSRAFQNGKFFAANNNLTGYFQTQFHLPKGHSWTEFTLNQNWTWRVMLCLIGKILTLVPRLPKTKKKTGRYSNSTPPHGTSTLSSKTMNNLTSSLLS